MQGNRGVQKVDSCWSRLLPNVFFLAPLNLVDDLIMD